MTNHFRGILSLMKELEARQEVRTLAEAREQAREAIKAQLVPNPTPAYTRMIERLKAEQMKEIYGTTVPDVQPPTFCVHEFVNVSFTGIKMVCKHCDVEQIL